jgi:ATP-dependent exoDNAse (exonuclease V) beta subunit
VADPHLELWGDAPGDAVEAPTEQWQRLQQELRTSLEDEWRRLAESLRPKREAEWLRWRTVLRDYVTAFHPTGQPLPDVVVDFGVGLRDLSLGPGGEGEPIRARTPALVNELNDLALACEARFPDEGARLVARAIESCAAEFHRRKKVRHLLTFDDLIQQLAQTLTSSGRSLAPRDPEPVSGGDHRRVPGHGRHAVEDLRDVIRDRRAALPGG